MEMTLRYLFSQKTADGNIIAHSWLIIIKNKKKSSCLNILKLYETIINKIHIVLKDRDHFLKV